MAARNVRKRRAVAEPLILINTFEVPGGQAGQFVAASEKTRDYLAAQPGYCMCIPRYINRSRLAPTSSS
jgi:hypothetical protein